MAANGNGVAENELTFSFDVLQLAIHFDGHD
jgi:hypothetical protein